ncbi:MAG: hypothetical protein ISR47_04660 [Rhodospirillales bacterium]|nr:hypothetical protein [Rhodospirillales bacterium]
MTETKKPNFPRTPDGVTDWELVFEAAEDGLIPLIRQTTTTTALYSCATIVISQLFVRKNDQLEIARLTTHLQKLFADDRASPDFKGLSDSVIGLLREIKNERIVKAQQYLAAKSTKTRGNKRSESFGQRLTKVAYRLVKEPKYLIATLLVILAVLTGILIAMVGIFDSAQQTQTPKKEEQLKVPITKKMDQWETDTETEDTEGIKAEQPDLPPVIALRRMVWPGAKAKRTTYIMPILLLDDGKEISTVCGLLPIIFDDLNTQFSKARANKTKPTAETLNAIGIKVMGRLNARLKRKTIVKMRLVANVDPKDRASRTCEQALPKFNKYLE